jgi:hypothetical protein
MEDPLKKYNLPSRAQLGMDSMLAPTQEQRDAAKALLAMLKEAGVKEDPQERRDSIWKVGFPSEEIMKLSPAGRLTLELLGSQSKEIQAKPEGNVAPVVPGPEPEPAPAAEAVPPEIPDDGINRHLKQLNWPPKSTPQPKATEDDGQPHKWVAGTPSPPDKSLRPISDWDNDLDNNRPIY